MYSLHSNQIFLFCHKTKSCSNHSVAEVKRQLELPKKDKLNVSKIHSCFVMELGIWLQSLSKMVQTASSSPEILTFLAKADCSWCIVFCPCLLLWLCRMMLSIIYSNQKSIFIVLIATAYKLSTIYTYRWYSIRKKIEKIQECHISIIVTGAVGTNV